MTRRLRAVGRWISDWRTGVTIVASVLVALLALVVIDSIQGERTAREQQSRALEELKERGARVNVLIADRDQLRADRDAVMEELRALRELLVDQDVVEPRAPQPSAEAPRTGAPLPAAPAPAGPAPPTPGPAATNPPTPPPPPPPSASPSPPCRTALLGRCLVP